MRCTLIAVLATIVFSLNSSYGQNQTGDNGTQKAHTITKAGMLSEKEIEELKTESTDEKTGQKIVFYASFGTAKPKSAFDKRKYEKSGKIPIRITCSLEDVKQINGRNVGKLLRGTAKICIMDSEGKVIETESVSLDKMCPS